MIAGNVCFNDNDVHGKYDITNTSYINITTNRYIFAIDVRLKL